MIPTIEAVVRVLISITILFYWQQAGIITYVAIYIKIVYIAIFIYWQLDPLIQEILKVRKTKWTQTTQ